MTIALWLLALMLQSGMKEHEIDWEMLREMVRYADEEVE